MTIGVFKSGKSGNAAIELVAMVPFIVLLMILTVQFAVFFAKAMRDVSGAETLAKKAANEWDISHLGKGFERPCIEKMKKRSFVSGSDATKIGMGAWAKKINVPQEVQIADDKTDICGGK